MKFIKSALESAISSNQLQIPFDCKFLLKNASQKKFPSTIHKLMNAWLILNNIHYFAIEVLDLHALAMKCLHEKYFNHIMDYQGSGNKFQAYLFMSRVFRLHFSFQWGDKWWLWILWISTALRTCLMYKLYFKLCRKV